ncbi:helix-turn-helix domain-containing protein [Vibrio sp. 10N.261.51.F12]|uniref:helix-turn-helix domain-containing protein n=1 Tax=Vibrio sp. 10N.261.51.F12 TaxID=3229679 RepID=UPI00354EE149
MSRIPATVPPFDYLGGREFTEKLKEVTGCHNYNLLADYFGIPKSTLLTWHTHNRTGFELIIREHLKSGASVRYMALGEGEPFEGEHTDSVSTERMQISKLLDGVLVESGNMAIDQATLERFSLKASLTQVVEDDAGIYYINQESTDPVTGDYLIDIDGRLSINYLQRLPGKKLAIAFGESTVEVAEEDIKVLGRVAMEMKKK